MNVLGVGVIVNGCGDIVNGYVFGVIVNSVGVIVNATEAGIGVIAVCNQIRAIERDGVVIGVIVNEHVFCHCQ